MRVLTILGRWTLAALFCIGVVAATGVALVALQARAQGPDAAQEVPARPVRTLPVAVQEGYAQAASFVGRIEPRRQTPVAFERAGLVLEVAADEGDRVAAGAVLARLDTATLDAERDRLVAELAAVEADRGLAEITRLRRAELNDRGFESAENLDQARFQVDALIAREAAVAAQIARLDLDIAKSVLRAPYDARVAERAIDEGAFAQPGAPVLTLQETAAPEARIGVPPDLLDGLAVGDAVALRYLGRDVPGRIAAVSPELDPATRTVALRVAIEADVVFGEVVRLDLARQINEPGFWVPLTALREGTRGLWSVFEVSGGVVQARTVEVLHVAGDRAFLRGDLPDGTPILAEGLHRVAPGQPVTEG